MTSSVKLESLATISLMEVMSAVLWHELLWHIIRTPRSPRTTAAATKAQLWMHSAQGTASLGVGVDVEGVSSVRCGFVGQERFMLCLMLFEEEKDLETIEVADSGEVGDEGDRTDAVRGVVTGAWPLRSVVYCTTTGLSRWSTFKVSRRTALGTEEEEDVEEEESEDLGRAGRSCLTLV